MLQTRLREIRKSKKLTLQDVADRANPPTTAQTIGRLETGVRTLSVDWIERIAAALDVMPEELIALPKGGDVVISGSVGIHGNVTTIDKTLSLRLDVLEPISIKIGENQGSYIADDTVLCSALPPTKYASALGQDCLIENTDGKRYFGKLIRYDNGDADLASLKTGGLIITGLKPVLIAPAKYQIRKI